MNRLATFVVAASLACAPFAASTPTSAAPTQDAVVQAPAAQAGAATDPVVSVGNVHTCVILATGPLKCFGEGSFGSLGNGDSTTLGDEAGEMGADLPIVRLGTGRRAVQVDAGNNATCAILDDDSLKCWGKNFGQLGIGDRDNRGDDPGEMGDALPTVDLGTGRTATQVAMGDSNACALLDNGSVKCWGNGQYGRNGYDDTTTRGDGAGEMGDSLPAVNLGTGRTATWIAAANTHVCAVLDNGSVKCWGRNHVGQLGLGDTVDRGDGSRFIDRDSDVAVDVPSEMGDALPAVNLGTGRTATQVSVGTDHTCALLDDASVKCWGSGFAGQIAAGASTAIGNEPGEMGDDLPAVDLGSGRTATRIVALSNATCVVLDDASVKCFGTNSAGELGTGVHFEVVGDSPADMGDALPTLDLGTGRTVSTIAAGGSTVCAVLDDSTVKCWGYNRFGQLGIGDSANRGDGPDEMGDALPVLVADGPVAVDVSVTAPSSVLVGNAIDYTITVENTEVNALSEVMVDADVDACDTVIASLAVAATETITCSYTTVAGDVPTATNAVSVTSLEGAGDSASVSTTVAALLLTPDTLVRVRGGAFVGDGVYERIDTTQVVTARVAKKKAQFTWRVQNDGTAATDYRLKARTTQESQGAKRFTAAYSIGGVDITTAVLDGTYQTRSIAPGAHVDITVTVTPAAKARSGNSLVLRVVQFPDEGQRDTATLVTTRT